MLRRFFFLLLVVSLILCSHSAPAQFLEAGVQKFEVPAAAPDFSLKALQDGEVSLKGLRGKVVILTFFSPLCSVCQRQTSSFDKLAEEIKNKEAVFLLVAVRVNESELVKYKEEFHVSIPILMDGDGSVAKAYKVWGHHETFFINREGKIVGKTFAEKDWASTDMRKLVRYLLVHD